MVLGKLFAYACIVLFVFVMAYAMFDAAARTDEAMEKYWSGVKEKEKKKKE